ncbi:phosphoglycolate phosphatase [Sagittula salina]|uniref:phosphoglycolate phosphatase n=1 Tax=Sagittula salina TaxID=2820268 RepID=A0A940MKH6_9RHOB|nr:phosphoglycolate phosphatase [Sagittula salina]MBP0481440.1 phosphoglycolate phosphatase [Sagittula salina]
MTTIAFDLDGTLIDSVPHIHHAVATALTELGLPAITVAETPGFVGRGLPILCEQVLAHVGGAPTLQDQLYARTMVHYVETPSDPSQIYPGVLAALDMLKRAGHRLTLCTNKPYAAAETALRDTRLGEWFDVVLGGDSLPTRKPAPEMLFAALDGADPARALYIGDSETDCETAQAAGVRFLLFTEGYRKSPPEALPHVARFSNWSELPAIVAGLA